MKRIILAAVAATLAALLITGCGPQKPKLYIYNWTYYIPEDVINEFQKRFGVKVVYDMYSSNEEMYAKLKVGGAGYDIVFPSQDFVSIMIREKMVEPIDKGRVPNFANLDTAMLSLITFDSGSQYSVPYAMGLGGRVRKQGEGAGVCAQLENI